MMVAGLGNRASSRSPNATQFRIQLLLFKQAFGEVQLMCCSIYDGLQAFKSYFVMSHWHQLQVAGRNNCVDESTNTRHKGLLTRQVPYHGSRVTLGPAVIDAWSTACWHWAYNIYADIELDPRYKQMPPAKSQREIYERQDKP
jgi:hypothetical protein